MRLSPGDVIIADALFDNYFLACELRQRGLELVARVQAERMSSRTVEARPDGDVVPHLGGPASRAGTSGGAVPPLPEGAVDERAQVTVDARIPVRTAPRCSR